ncbi:MAG: winged helix-turn-helix transcriptional regulator [bacterium]|nr:winged helix-turn-helix transcriptional regulator [bacterium]
MRDMEPVFKSLGHEKRLRILDWLKDPEKHFRPQKDGDLVQDGVCVLLIAEKLGVRQPTATQHLKILLDAELVKAKRIGKWTFISRNEERIAKLKKAMTEL